MQSEPFSSLRDELLASSLAFVRQSVVVVVLLEHPPKCEEVWDTNFGLATLELSAILPHNPSVPSVDILQLN